MMRGLKADLGGKTPGFVSTDRNCASGKEIAHGKLATQAKIAVLLRPDWGVVSNHPWNPRRAWISEGCC
jgi:ABC-type phosphonate transport system ATPase subunit